MTVILLLILLALFVVPVWAMNVVFGPLQPNRPLRIYWCITVALAAISAYFSTFHYVFHANINTRFHGWPVPIVIYQRDGPDAPWLDFVGWTVILAYPANVALFVFVPALLFLVLAYRNRRKAGRREGKWPNRTYNKGDEAPR